MDFDLTSISGVGASGSMGSRTTTLSHSEQAVVGTGELQTSEDAEYNADAASMSMIQVNIAHGIYCT